jgi:CheY-like chemotaxis protein
VANNGREVVDILSDGPQPPPFDVVLMDLQMPVMDGYQATAKLRGDARFANLTIIAMTAHATMEEKQRCLAAGMNDHISKPIDPDNLYETVGRFYKPDAFDGVRQSSAAATSALAQAHHDSNAAATANPAAPGGDSKLTQASDLPSVTGLDTKDGLTRVAGNRKLHLKLLRQFVEQQGPAVTQINEALSRNDNAAAERLAHTVKGVAGNLGARAIQQLAGKVEKAISTKVPAAELAPLLQDLRSTLEEFVNSLRAAFPVAEPAPTTAAAVAPVDPEKAKGVVQAMIGHLNNFDPAAGESLEANREVFRSLLSEDKFASFEQHISGFAFAEALALLEPAAKEKGLLPA